MSLTHEQAAEVTREFTKQLAGGITYLGYEVTGGPFESGNVEDSWILEVTDGTYDFNIEIVGPPADEDL